ncbi:MAG: hypothetical protein LBH18_03435 [Spirochaetaceae bacterium]|nr:hypothetical protein [Spirochaetaceae bacterium]
MPHTFSLLITHSIPHASQRFALGSPEHCAVPVRVLRAKENGGVGNIPTPPLKN